VHLEGSGKWPDDAAAFAKAKAALGCELAEALATNYALEARVAEAHVDVFVDGFVLRVLLWSDRDEALATRATRVRPPTQPLAAPATVKWLTSISRAGP